MATPIPGKGATVQFGNGPPMPLVEWKILDDPLETGMFNIPGTGTWQITLGGWSFGGMESGKLLSKWRRQARKRQRRYQRQKRKQ